VRVQVARPDALSNPWVPDKGGMVTSCGPGPPWGQAGRKQVPQAVGVGQGAAANSQFPLAVRVRYRIGGGLAQPVDKSQARMKEMEEEMRLLHGALASHPPVASCSQQGGRTRSGSSQLSCCLGLRG